MLNVLPLCSITPDTFIVTENNQKVGGTIAINEAANGFAIFTFTPKKAFASNANIKVTLTTAIKDDAGLGLESDYVLEYQTSAATTTNAWIDYSYFAGSPSANFYASSPSVSALCSRPWPASALPWPSRA